MNIGDYSKYIQKSSEELNKQLDEISGTPAWLSETFDVQKKQSSDIEEIRCLSQKTDSDSKYRFRVATIIAVISLIVSVISLVLSIIRH